MIVALLFGFAYARQRWITFGFLGLPLLIVVSKCLLDEIKKIREIKERRLLSNGMHYFSDLMEDPEERTKLEKLPRRMVRSIIFNSRRRLSLSEFITTKTLLRYCGILSLTVFAISVIYLIAWSTLFLSFETNGRWVNTWTYLYFSVVTFTTLGFGDVTPLNNISEAWVMGEVTLGYVMLGGLISIFANKLARRS